MDLGGRARFSGMAEFAVFHRPGDFSIMANAAKFTVDNFVHIDVVSPGLEFKADVSVTDFALKSYSVKPVREYRRAHAGFVRVIINDYIAVFGAGFVERRRAHEDKRRVKRVSYVWCRFYEWYF